MHLFSFNQRPSERCCAMQKIIPIIHVLSKLGVLFSVLLLVPTFVSYLFLDDALPETARSVFYQGLNRGKKSVALDVRRPETAGVLARLVDRADVVVESFRPQTARRFGVSAEQNKRVLTGIVRDVSERKHAEEEPAFPVDANNLLFQSGQTCIGPRRFDHVVGIDLVGKTMRSRAHGGSETD